MSCHFCILCLHRKLKSFSRRMWSKRQCHRQRLIARADLLASRHDVGCIFWALDRPLEDGCHGLGSIENPTPTSLDPANKSTGMHHHVTLHILT